MVGLRLPQAVQDGVESFLIEQGPLRHSRSRVTSGSPVCPQQGEPHWPPQHQHCTPKAGTRRPQCAGGAGFKTRTCPPRCCCHQPWPVAQECVPVPPRRSHSYLLRGEVMGWRLDLGRKVKRQGVPEAWSRPQAAETAPHGAGHAGARGPLLPGPPAPSAAHLFPQQASWESSPRAALPVPWPAVAEVHGRSAAPAA